MTSVFTRLTPNLVRNGRVDTLDDLNANIGGSGAVGSLLRVTGTPPAGYTAYARAVVTTSGTSGSEYVDLRNIGTETNLVSPGTTYDFGVVARGNFPGDEILFIQWLNAAAAVISTDQSTPTLGSGSWVTYSVQGVAPALAVRAQLIRRRVPTSGDAAVNNYVDATGWTFRASPASTDIVTPELVTGYQSSRRPGSVVHLIAGSNTYRATLWPAGPRSGVLELLFDNPLEAARAETIFSTASVFKFTDSDVPEVNMSFVVPVTEGELAVEIGDESRSEWLVKVPYAEVPLA